MKQFIQLAATTGHTYEIPVAVVANNRAAAMLELHKDEFQNLAEALADTVELFKDSLFDIQDWAQNNMNWSDLEPHARLIRFTPPEFDFANDGEWTYHDHRAINGELDGEGIMKSPVELVATIMTEAQQLCNVTVLNGADGQPFGAVVVIMAPPAVVGAYITALQFIGDQITGGKTGAVTH